MKIRLKDKRLQERLDELTDGDFSRRLSITAPENREGIFVACGPTVPPHMGRRFTISFENDELEGVPEYNPNRWNRFPDVTPPKGVWMRLVISSPEGASRHCARFLHNHWGDYSGKEIPIGRYETAIFMPWEQES